MKITLKKDWKFVTMSGKDVWKKGSVLLDDKRVKYLNHEDGFLIRHFYAYGQSEIIPLNLLKIKQ